MSQRIFSSADFQEAPARGRRSGGASVAARVVSALLGLLVTVPALVLVMIGGTRAYSESSIRSNMEPVPVAVLLISAGLVLVLVVALTGLLSSLGPFVAGLVASAAGIAFLVNPMLIGPATDALPVFEVSRVSIVTFWCQSGLLFVTGIVLLASGLGRVIAARVGGGRRGAASTIVALVVGIVATPFGLGLVAMASVKILRESTSAAESMSPSPGPSGLVLLLAGALVLSGVALTAGWRSVGAAVAGALTLLLGLLAFVPQGIIWVYRTMSAPFGGDGAGGASAAVALGFVAVIGVLLLGAAASAARAHRAAR